MRESEDFSARDQQVPTLALRSSAANERVGSNKPIRVGAIVGVRLYREALASSLTGGAIRTMPIDPADWVPGSAKTDVLLMDYSTPKAAGLIKAILRSDPEARIIVLGIPDSDEVIISWAEAGVSGYIDRDGSLGVLRDSIEQAFRGDLPGSSRLALALWRRAARSASRSDQRASGLTRRELEVVRFIQAGLSNKEIASNLHIEVATVKNHVHSTLRKLHVHGRLELARAISGLRSQDEDIPLRTPKEPDDNLKL